MLFSTLHRSTHTQTNAEAEATTKQSKMFGMQRYREHYELRAAAVAAAAEARAEQNYAACAMCQPLAE